MSDGETSLRGNMLHMQLTLHVEEMKQVLCATLATRAEDIQAEFDQCVAAYFAGDAWKEALARGVRNELDKQLRVSAEQAIRRWDGLGSVMRDAVAVALLQEEDDS
jgi:hypothetical protein